MTTLRGRVAVVIGASSGVGRATARALVSEGAKLVAVARGAQGLSDLQAALGEGVETLRADAADPATAERLLRELRPELVVLAAGVRPHMGALDELSWEEFSEAWNCDVRAAFHLVKAAIALPLVPGSSVVIVSSGAAIAGSPLSGGYAGAKRMQWLLAGYAQKLAERKQLGIRFLAVLPKQLIEGTEIGAKAATAYGHLQGISSADFMKRFEVPLDSDKVAHAILAGLRGEVATSVTAVGVTGNGIESLG